MCINSINIISNVLPPPCLSRANLNGVLKTVSLEKNHFGFISLVSKSLIYLTLLLASALVIKFIPNRFNVDMTYYDFL